MVALFILGFLLATKMEEVKTKGQVQGEEEVLNDGELSRFFRI